MLQPQRAPANVDLSPFLDQYSVRYLQQYWPENPEKSAAWEDNIILMNAYQDAGLAILAHFNAPVSVLDIGTGPALTPLLGILPAVREIQLSDFQEVNRTCLSRMPVEYWRNYVPLLIKLFPDAGNRIDEVLSQLDRLRSQRQPLHVDLFASSPLPTSVDPSAFEVISMNFVADGITDQPAEYFRCLNKVTDLVRTGGLLTMSAITNSSWWMIGETKYPSPNVSEAQILQFLAEQNLTPIQLTRSVHQPGQTYDGGWIVVTALKHTSTP